MTVARSCARENVSGAPIHGESSPVVRPDKLNCWPAEVKPQRADLLTDSITPLCSCEPIASVAPKDPHLLAALGALCIAHVLHHPYHLKVCLQSHLARFERNTSRISLR